MRPIADPRRGDIEDDASSTKQRTLASLAGSLLAEISLPKLAAAWGALIVLPVLVLGLGPLLASIWIGTISAQAAFVFTGLWPFLVLVLLGVAAWFGGRPLFPLVEANFWSLNALAVQPGYALVRELLRHLSERFLPIRTPRGREIARAVSAAIAGLVVCLISALLFSIALPEARWSGTFAELSHPAGLALAALAKSLFLH